MKRWKQKSGNKYRSPNNFFCGESLSTGHIHPRKKYLARLNNYTYMLTIRLTRKGKKNQPFFRVVVIDKRRSSKGGRAVEDLGYKNPLTKKISINKERALYWISKGAKPSATIHNMFVSEKIIDAKKIHVARAKKTAEATPAAVAPATTKAPAEIQAPVETPAPAAAPAPEIKQEEKPTEVKKEEVIEQPKA